MAIRYPSPLRPGDRIGVTAPPRGIGKDLQGRLDFCIDYLCSREYDVVIGE